MLFLQGVAFAPIQLMKKASNTSSVLGLVIGGIGDLESLKSNQPSKFNIDAVSDSEIILFRDRDFNKLLSELPAFNKMIITIHDRSFMAAQQRILSFISHSAEEKYLAFLEMHPGFADYIPKNMIASFLGITRETLSRVRKATSNR
jgi:CRP-like cAMP-binding protein